MNTLIRRSHFLVIVLLLGGLLLGQMVYAQEPDRCTNGVPQWVLDRQQYETTYVYVPQVGDCPPTESMSHIPQWVLDRQQYETTYIYVPQVNDLLLAESVPCLPQWVVDCQQYEPNYIYIPPEDNSASGVQKSGS